jgi:hypothetical protein
MKEELKPTQRDIIDANNRVAIENFEKYRQLMKSYLKSGGKLFFSWKKDRGKNVKQIFLDPRSYTPEEIQKIIDENVAKGEGFELVGASSGVNSTRILYRDNEKSLKEKAEQK